MMRSFGWSEFLFILQAAQWTVGLSLIAFIGGAIGGLIVALSRTCDSPLARLLSGGFIQIFQGTPLLLQLFLVFFGAPVLGFDINPWVAAGVALIHSFEVPFPDSGVSNTVEYHAPVDFVQLEWPVTDLNYSISNYSYGAPCFRAPAFSGCLTSILS